MKKVLWTLLAVLCLTLLMISAAAADSLPALQVELTSSTVTRGEFLELQIMNLDDYYPYRFNDEYQIVAEAEGSSSGFYGTGTYRCNQWGFIRIPTQGLDPAGLAGEDEGKFRVVVTAMGFGYEPVTAEKTFTVTEPNAGTFTFTISDDEVVPEKQYVLSVYAPGAQRIEIHDNWKCVGSTSSDQFQMEYGYHFRGTYTYYAYAYYYDENNEETRRVVGPKTVNVATDADVPDPGVTAPGVLEWGNDLVFEIGTLNGYSRWNLNIRRVSDGGEVWHSWGDPMSEIRVPWQGASTNWNGSEHSEGYRNRILPGECYNIELGFFRYGYHGFTLDVPLLAVDESTMVNTIETTVNGKKGTLALSAPEELVLRVQGPANATGLLVFAGHDWQFVKGNEYRADWEWWTLSHIPEYLFFAKYTTDEIPSTEFDWRDLNWSENTGNVVRLINQTRGWIPVPEVQLDQQDAEYARGEWITAAITNLDDYAGYEGLRFCAAPYYDPTGEGFGHLYDWDSATGTIRIPTSDLSPATHPGTFTLSVTALATGWYDSSAYSQFTVVEPAGTASFFTVSPTSVATGEDYTVSLYAPEAAAYRILENGTEVRNSSGNSLTEHRSADEEGTRIYQAQIRKTAGGSWIDVGSAVTVTVAAAQPLPELTLSGQGLLMEGENLLLSFAGISSVDGVDLNVWKQTDSGEERVWHSWGTEQPFVVYARQPEQAYHQEAFCHPGEAVLEAGNTYRYRLHITKRGYRAAYLQGAFSVIASHESLPSARTVQLLVNGSNASPQTVTANSRTPVIVQAPGATGIRVLDPNRWDPDGGQNIETADCWNYYDRGWNPEYLEIYQNFEPGAASVIAEARYDDYDDIRDCNGAGSCPWTVQSTEIALAVSDNGQSLPAPAVSMDSSVARGSWLTVSITNPQGRGEWYWADLDRSDGEWLAHYDFNDQYELAIPTDEYEQGSYRLRIFSGAPGYAEHGYTEKTFTVSGSGSTGSFLKVNKNLAAVGEDIFLSACSAGDKRLEITREGRPDWFERRNWGEGYAFEAWKNNEPGTYVLTLLDSSGTAIGSQTVTLTLEAGKGQLSKPDLSGMPAKVTVGQAYAGTFAVDPLTEWVDINVSYMDTQGGRENVYHSNRRTTDANYSALHLPASVISRAGRYIIDISSSAPGYQNHSTGYVFLVKEADSGSQALTLTVNGSMDDILSWPSSKNVQIQVHGEGATAIRLLRDENWEDVEGWTDGTVRWSKGFGDGDHILIAQMTTDEPRWRADGFDWSKFNWNEDVTWTTLSNPVKIHVESQGTLTEPTVTLKSGDRTLQPDGTVTRGDVLTVTAAEQDHAGWVWAEVKVLRFHDDGGRWFDTLQNGHYDSGGHSLTLKIPTAGIPAGSYYLQVGIDAENWDGRDTYVPFTVAEPAGGTVEPGLEFSQDSMQASEGVSILAWAPGASRMELDITWDRNPYWRDHRETGRDSESWGWGCVSGGVYTFTLKYYMPNQDDPGTIVKTLTVTSDGSLGKPKLNDIPDILTPGNGIQGSFDAVGGAEWYSVGVRYSGNGYDWDDLLNEDRAPDQANATRLHFSGRFFSREGLYQVWVSANAVGKDNGYAEKQIQVLDPSSITSILILPSGLTEIESEAFAGVAAQKIIVPAGVTSIGPKAFANCRNLMEIDLPEGISHFAYDAFDGCGTVYTYGPANSDLEGYAANVNRLVFVAVE